MAREPNLVSWVKDHVTGMYEIDVAVGGMIYTYVVEATPAMRRIYHRRKSVFTFTDLNKIKILGRLLVKKPISATS